MATLKEDIINYSDWIVNAFKEDGFNLNYTIKSFIEIDKFLQLHIKDGQPVKGRRLSKNLGVIVFALGAYIGETLIKNVPESKWIIDEKDPQGEVNISVDLGNGNICFPGQKIMKRIQNGLEEGIYPYGHSLTLKILNEKFDESFWEITKNVKPFEPKKPWWKF